MLSGKFVKSSVAGFFFGASVAIAISQIKVRRRGWIAEIHSREVLTKKESLALINDQKEELEILKKLYSLTSETAESFYPYYEKIRVLALANPFWEGILTRIDNLAS
jgi:hypothetical protein